ncbi:MAG: group I intron-associated PD-(D/E)XK endonuclease [Nitrospirota bacterium]
MPKTIFDLDITGRIAKLGGNILGDAHEHYVTAILMRLGFDVSVASVKGGPYDLLITAYKNGTDSEKVILRAQVKTCSTSISFIGGVRGGVDREYKSGVKEYKYSEEHNDLIIGVKKSTLDLYLVPTRFLKHFGKSKSLNQLDSLKNNWEILLNWREEWLEKVLATITTYSHL